MRRLIILHSNDIHGHVEGLTRIGSVVSQIRANNPDAMVLYFDLGDSEEYAKELSSLTKGAAMHRLLAAAGCNGAVVGNAVLARYGPEAVTNQVNATTYPHLAANVRLVDGALIPGVQASILVEVGPLRLGLIGVTSANDNYELFYDLQMLPTFPLVRELITSLKDEGANTILLLSHCGLDRDREMATELQGELLLLLGAHTHDLLPEGEWVGNVLIAQAGEYAQHLGRVDLEWDGTILRPVAASVLPITEAIVPSPTVLAMLGCVEEELQKMLDEVICEVVEPLELAIDRECGIGNLVADALRHCAQAEIGIAAVGPVFLTGLPAGPLRRKTLWTICPGPSNPGVVTMTGKQLETIIQRGLNPDIAVEQPKPLRGQARGLMHISGALMRQGKLLINGKPLDPTCSYRVAASDFELEPWWGYTEKAWKLSPKYETSIILREMLADYLIEQEVISVEMGRLG